MLNGILGRPGEDLLGLVLDFGTKLRNGTVTAKAAKRFMRGENPWPEGVPRANRFLSFVANVTVEGFGTFVPRAYFREGESTHGVKIASLGENFKSYFLRETEVSVPAVNLRVHHLHESSFCSAIITELGGDEEVEISISHLFLLLEAHGKGKETELSTDGYANIFYVRGVNHILWAVRVLWKDNGWHVDAHELGNPSMWARGCPVFSR